MKIKPIITPTRNIVLLLHGSGVPCLMFNLYLMTAKSNLSEKRLLYYATIFKRVSLFYSELNIDFEKHLISGDFQPIFKTIPNFFDDYLQILNLSEEAFNLHVRVLKEFTSWALNRYLHNSFRHTDRINKLKANNAIKCGELFDSFLTREKITPKEFKVIDNYIIDNMMDFILSKIKNNSSVAFRNYLIIRLFYETGIRLGELLNLKTTDLLIEKEITYIKIVDSDIPDIRKDRAKIKNIQSSRIIALSKPFSTLIEEYILNGRRNNYPKIGRKTSHPFLFTSKLGKPLSKTNLYLIFNTLNENIESDLDKKIKITPHMLRHSFAYNFLKYLIDDRGLDMERAKDELRVTCGWSPSSNMPQHYAGKYIWETANRHNITRINALYGQQN